MSTSTWTGSINSHWGNGGNWSPTGVPGARSDVAISKGNPIAAASIGTVNSITNSADLSFQSAGTNTVTTFLDNTGSLSLDAGAGEGGTILNISGPLTNSSTLRVGNTTLSAPDVVTAASLDNTATGLIYVHGSPSKRALLDIAGRAGFGTKGILSGYVQLGGDSAIEFASGKITSLAASAQLHLDGNDAFIEDSKAMGSNSALTGLASISAGATFELNNKAAVTTGAFANDGNVYLDANPGVGGSSLSLAGALTNSGDLAIGNTTLSAADEVAAASLDNTGSIHLRGSSANQALLDVTGAAGFGTAGTLTGTVDLTQDSAIEFRSGQISTIGASSQLTLDGSNAVIEDGASGSNSALSGLTNVAGSLYLASGASLSTGALTNNGLLGMDLEFDSGGSAFSVAGGLTNNGSLYIGVGAGGLSATDTLTVDTLSNANAGVIGLYGNGSNQALLDVTTGVAGFGTAGTVTGTVTLAQDSAIEFLNGEITTIAAGGDLVLTGNNAFIEDGATGSNNALTGLANIKGSGALYLEDGAQVSTDGPLTNSGFLGVDYFSGDGGAALSVDGLLTNSGGLQVGNIGDPSPNSITATSFVNSGKVQLTGAGNVFAALNVSGATTNNGAISIGGDTETLAGAVGGKGSISVTGSHLLFNSSVSAGQTIHENDKDELTLTQAQNFHATIAGFGTNDTIDATNFVKTATSYNFVENSGGTGGTLTLTDGSLIANILLTGSYTKSDFSLAPDSGTGTLVKFV